MLAGKLALHHQYTDVCRLLHILEGPERLARAVPALGLVAIHCPRLVPPFR